MNRVASSVFLSLLVSACGAPAQPAAVEPPPSRPAATSAKPAPKPAEPEAVTKQLDADTPMKTASGAGFEAPKGWFVTTKRDLVTLEGPERDLSIAMLEVAKATDAPAALAAAWQRVKPGFALAEQKRVSPPASDGWDEITQLTYVTPSAEGRIVIGIARKKDGVFHVALVDGKLAALERRGAQLQTVLTTFKPPGVEEESFAGKTPRPIDAARKLELEAFVNRALEKIGAPGAAIALVQGGKVVWEQGFGVRELGKKDKVGPNTLFMIGSVTKSLTTLAMAKLVDQGKLAWDAPLKQALPEFGLGDPAVEAKALVKHSVCACTGLPRQDLELLFEFAGVTPEQRLAAMKSMKPTTGFGETFQYSNSMVAAGGWAAARAFEPKKKLGPAYDAAMAKLVFEPLEMKATTFDFTKAKASEHASPHARDVAGVAAPLPLSVEEFVLPLRPSGGAWSTVRDMARVAMLELAKGKTEKGVEVISAANLLKRREPQIKVTDKSSYGMGLMVSQENGIKSVWHNGTTLGFSTRFTVLPEYDLGWVMVTNVSGPNALLGSIERRLLEVLFDGKPEAEAAIEFVAKQRKANVEKELAKITREPDAAWSKALVGAYAEPGLGKATVKLEKNALTFDAGEWKSRVGQLKDDDGTVKAVLLDPPVAGLELVIAAEGGNKSLVIETPQRKYAFTAAQGLAGGAKK